MFVKYRCVISYIPACSPRLLTMNQHIFKSVNFNRFQIPTILWNNAEMSKSVSFGTLFLKLFFFIHSSYYKQAFSCQRQLFYIVSLSRLSLVGRWVLKSCLNNVKSLQIKVLFWLEKTIYRFLIFEQWFHFFNSFLVFDLVKCSRHFLRSCSPDDAGALFLPPNLSLGWDWRWWQSRL